MVVVVFPVSFWFFLGVSGQLAFTKTHCRMIVYGFLRLIENASWWMSNLLERVYRNSGHPDAIQGIDCANFFNSKKHILQIPMQYIYLYIFFLALQISSKKICKKKILTCAGFDCLLSDRLSKQVVLVETGALLLYHHRVGGIQSPGISHFRDGVGI